MSTRVPAGHRKAHTSTATRRDGSGSVPAITRARTAAPAESPVRRICRSGRAASAGKSTPRPTAGPIDLSDLLRAPQVGHLMRRFRVECGLTQSDVAQQLHITAQALANYETGQRTPDPQVFARWCAIVDVPSWQLPKLSALIAPGLSWLSGGPYIGAPADGDPVSLEALNVPAWLLSSASLDVLYANQHAAEALPGAEPGSGAPTNLLDVLLRPPSADTGFDCETLAKKAVDYFRVYAPGAVAAERIVDIIRVCERYPTFARYWASPAEKQGIHGTRLTMTGLRPGTAAATYTVHFWHADRCALLMLTPN